MLIGSPTGGRVGMLFFCKLHYFAYSIQIRALDYIFIKMMHIQKQILHMFYIEVVLFMISIKE